MSSGHGVLESGDVLLKISELRSTGSNFVPLLVTRCLYQQGWGYI